MPIQNDPQRKLPTRPAFDVRKHPVHGISERSDQPTIIFLTACTKDRSCWLADSDVHNLIRTCWLEADTWKVGRYVLMPDDLHLFASPGPDHFAFDNWVRYWKSLMTRALRDPGRRLQTDHWDTRMRSADAYAEK